MSTKSIPYIYSLAIAFLLLLRAAHAQELTPDHGDEFIIDNNVSFLDIGVSDHLKLVNLNIPSATGSTFVNTAYGTLFHKIKLLDDICGFPLPFELVYNSQSFYRGRYGRNWQFSYAMRYITNDKNESVIIVRSDDRRDVFIHANGKYFPGYGVFDKLTKSSNGFILHEMREDKDGNVVQVQYHFDSPEHNYLTGILVDFAFETILEYDNEHKLVKISADNGLTVSLGYSGGFIKTLRFDAADDLVSFGYDANDRLVQFNDMPGNTTGFAYDDCDNLIEIENEKFKKFNIEYDTEFRVIGTNGPAGFPDLSFEYNEQEAICSHDKGDGNKWIYDYDGDRRIKSVTNPLGDTTNYTYDSEYRLTKITDALANETSYSYDANGLLVNKVNPDAAEFTYERDMETGRIFRSTVAQEEELLSQTTFTMYNIGKVVGKTESNGRDIRYEWGVDDRLKGIEDNAYGSAKFLYDSLGRLSNMQVKPGKNFEDYYSIERDYYGRPLIVTDNIGRDAAYFYDALGKIIEYTDADDNRFIYEYDATGRLIRVLDERNNVRTYSYNNAGNLSEATDQIGKKVKYEYDAAGRLSKFTDELAGEIIYDYDAAGRLILIRDQIGNTRTFGYDANNRVVRRTTGELETNYEYDAMGRLIRESGDEEREYSYDGMGNLLRIDYSGLEVFLDYENTLLRSAGTQTTNYFVYDYAPNGLLSKVTNPLSGEIREFIRDSYGNITEEIINGASYKKEYDAFGNITKLTDPLDNSTTYAYDGLGRLQEKYRPDDIYSQYYYRPDGRPIIEDFNIGTYNHTYDETGRLKKIKDPRGFIVDFAYDDAGRMAGYSDRNGNITIFDYDAVGRLIKTTYPEGNSESYNYDESDRLVAYSDGNGNEFKYDYDGNNLAAINSPDDAVEKFEYDESGNLVSYTDGEENEYNFSYIGSGLLKEIRTPLENFGFSFNYFIPGLTSEILLPNSVFAFSYTGGLLTAYKNPLDFTRTYSYDEAGNLLASTLENGSRINYQHNSAGQLVKSIFEDGTEETYEYDQAGNPWKITLRSGPLITYSFTSRSNLFKIYYLGGPEPEFTYDKEENIVSMNNKEPVFIYEYDKNNRLLKITEPFDDFVDMEREFIYDGNGNIKSVINDELEYSYHYDAHNRLIRNVYPLGGTETFEYNKNGTLKQKNSITGKTTMFNYDLLGRLLTLNSSSFPQTMQFDYDAAGNLSEIDYSINVLDIEGDLIPATENFEYDAMGRLTKKRDLMDKETRFTYDSLGNLLSERYEGSISQFVYDINGMLRSVESSLHGKWELNVNADGYLHNYTHDGRDYRWSFGAGMRVQWLLGPTGQTTFLSRHNYADGIHELTKNVTGRPAIVYYFDQSGRLREIIERGTNEKYSFEYNQLGQIRGIKDSYNDNTQFEYDGKGMLRSIRKTLPSWINLAWSDDFRELTLRNQNNDTIKYRYDQRGRLTSGSVLGGDNKNILFRRAWVYDPLFDRPSRYINESGGITNYSYDAFGRLVSSQQSGYGKHFYEYNLTNNGLTASGRIIADEKFYDLTLAYNQSGPSTISDALDGEHTFEYDNFGRVIRHSYNQSFMHGYEYDIIDRITKSYVNSEDFTGYTYDNIGRLTKLEETRGMSFEYLYDDQNTIICRSPDIDSITYTFDVLDNLIKMEQGDNIIRYLYDDDRNIIRKDYPDTTSVEYTYDAEGNLLTSQSHGNNGETIDRLYDFRRLPTLSGINYNGIFNKTERYGYNLNGDLIRRVTPELDTIRYNYDNFGRLLGVNAGDYASEFSYDEFGRKTSNRETSGLTTEYTYDALGRTKQIKTYFPNPTDTINLKQITYEYDNAGRLKRRTIDSNLAEYTYDSFGRLIEYKDRDTEIEITPFEDITIDGDKKDINYDLYGRMTDWGNILYEYDSFGNVNKIINGTVEFELNYDFENRLSEINSSLFYVHLGYSDEGDILTRVANGDIDIYLPDGLFLREKRLNQSIATVYNYRNEIKETYVNEPLQEFNNLLFRRHYSTSQVLSFFPITDKDKNVHELLRADLSVESVFPFEYGNLFLGFNDTTKYKFPAGFAMYDRIANHYYQGTTSINMPSANTLNMGKSCLPESPKPFEYYTKQGEESINLSDALFDNIFREFDSRFVRPELKQKAPPDGLAILENWLEKMPVSHLPERIYVPISPTEYVRDRWAMPDTDLMPEVNKFRHSPLFSSIDYAGCAKFTPGAFLHIENPDKSGYQREVYKGIIDSFSESNLESMLKMILADTLKQDYYLNQIRNYKRNFNDIIDLVAEIPDAMATYNNYSAFLVTGQFEVAPRKLQFLAPKHPEEWLPEFYRKQGSNKPDYIRIPEHLRYKNRKALLILEMLLQHYRMNDEIIDRLSEY